MTEPLPALSPTYPPAGVDVEKLRATAQSPRRLSRNLIAGIAAGLVLTAVVFAGGWAAGSKSRQPTIEQLNTDLAAASENILALEGEKEQLTAEVNDLEDDLTSAEDLADTCTSAVQTGRSLLIKYVEFMDAYTNASDAVDAGLIVSAGGYLDDMDQILGEMEPLGDDWRTQSQDCTSS